jgi:predicted ATPase
MIGGEGERLEAAPRRYAIGPPEVSMFKPVVRSLILKRFRSFPSERIELDNPTFFVGRNGSGKSNLVDAFSFLADAMAAPLQAVFDRRGGITAVRDRTSGKSYPPNLGLGVEFGNINGTATSGRYAFEVRTLPNYGFEVVREQCRVENSNSTRVWFERERGSFRSNVRGLDPALDPAALSIPLVGGDARFAPVVSALSRFRVYSIEPAKLREMQDPDGGTSLRRDGSNAASVLQEIGRHSAEQLDRVGEILATIAPNTRAVRVRKHGNKLSLEFTQEWDDAGSESLRFEAFNMSDGTLRALSLLAAVFQRPAPSLIAIEEPEATIHPGALGAVLELLRHAAKNMQVVVTTHSPDLLDAKWIEPKHLRVVEWANGATRVGDLSEATRQALRDQLMGAGELLRSNALRAEPLFADVTHPPQASLFDTVEEPENSRSAPRS